MDVSAILKRAKDRLGISTDFELARILGVSKSTLSNWKARNSIDYDVLFTNCKLADFDWLIRGEERDPSRLTTVYDRILEILSREGVNIREFEKNIGTIPTIMSGAIRNSDDKNIQKQWAEVVTHRYPAYSLDWILTGNGNMIKSEEYLGNKISGVVIHGDNVANNSPIEVDNRQYYSDSPDVLRSQIDALEKEMKDKMAIYDERIKEKDAQIKEKDAQIKEKDAQIKEKDAQIKQLLDILQKK